MASLSLPGVAAIAKSSGKQARLPVFAADNVAWDDRLIRSWVTPQTGVTRGSGAHRPASSRAFPISCWSTILAWALCDDLPAVPISRLLDRRMAELMTSCVLFATIRHAREIPLFERARRRRQRPCVRPKALSTVQVSILGLVVPADAKMRGVLGERELDLLPQHAKLINVSRGVVVEERLDDV
jgi:hypothetical protein